MDWNRLLHVSLWLLALVLLAGVYADAQRQRRGHDTNLIRAEAAEASARDAWRQVAELRATLSALEIAHPDLEGAR